MRDMDFIAWSLVVAGAFVAIIFGTARAAQAALGKPFYRPEPAERALVLFISLMFGAGVVRLALKSATPIEPPRWSALVIGVMLLGIGAWNLRFGKPHKFGAPSTRTLGWILLIIGSLSLALCLSILASGGTAS